MDDVVVFQHYQQLYQFSLGDLSWVNLLTMGLTYPTWIISYLLMIRKAHKDKMYASPLVACAVMFGYETCFLFIWPIHEISPAFAYAFYFEVLWWILDAILLIQCGLYAKASLPGSMLAEWPWLTVAGAAVLGVVGMYCFVDWTGMTDGVGAAVVAVAIIGVQFPLFIWERQEHAESLGKATYNGGKDSEDGISYWAIVWRAIGDVATVAAVFQLYLFVNDGHRPEGEVGGTEGVVRATETLEPFYLAVGDTLDGHDLHFALAPISAANSFTWFLMVMMLLADLTVVLYLTLQHHKKSPIVRPTTRIKEALRPSED